MVHFCLWPTTTHACRYRLATAQDMRYLHDLNTQMSEKRQTVCAEQQMERELCSKHFETFDTFWGRPGHGAPGEVTAKQKLNNLLYGASSECWD
ncbi:PREDICTED: uncharacterized protein LOC108371527 [Rhagoletis zephyria]|uniref:uncharacterized protein LOC108371527 n=1 Tax=Rhagoletis zephyria TaxID=28612 RepID=UPI0008118A80|nr:PREDICTED: uncharacterized protein LOC108371527 [Rhagoletis zephyria]